MYILGISAFYHDSAACLIKDGEIISASQEERYTRKKHDPSFPHHAIKNCLAEAGINGSEVDHVVFYEKPFLKFERLLETYLAFAPRGFLSFSKAIPVWLKDKLFQKSILGRELSLALGNSVDWTSRLLFSEHHMSHAASAFFPSPFDSAAILTLDGVGEWTTTSISVGFEDHISIKKELKFPHSLGLLYSAFTYYTGFKVNSGEYKVMGLAPYGEPRFAGVIRDELISIAEDGSFQLNLDYFDFATGLQMTSNKFHAIFGGPPRTPEAIISQKEMDLAASIQTVVNDIVIRIGQNIVRETGQRNLCLAGGVALNCVANAALSQENIFEKIWIQPAAGDAGGSLGAALAAWHLHFGKKRYTKKSADAMKGAFLGPSYSNQQIEKELKDCGAVYKKLKPSDLIESVANYLSKGDSVGWFQGRMEFGPRALGGRSILADPRSPKMQRQLNLKVKYRESFRPFAPSVLKESVTDWFEEIDDSPYMLLVAKIHKNRRLSVPKKAENLIGIEKLNVARSTIPAVTHVDYTARVQTVQSDTNPSYHALISKFEDITGCPILVNTSFNVRGEPIVCSPTDAFNCFMGTELEILAIGDFLLKKDEQNISLKQNYEKKYERD